MTQICSGNFFPRRSCVRLLRVLMLVAVVESRCVSANDRVVIVTPHTESIRAEIGSGFARWYQAKFDQTPRVEWRDVGGTADALRFVQSEFSSKPNGIGVDVFFGGGPEPYLLLADKKLLDRYDPPADLIAGIPQSFNGVQVYDPNHFWYGAALSSFGILQSTRLERQLGLPLVTRWDQLAEPRLFGWVGAGDPRNSGTMNNMFEAFLQAYGWERGWELLHRIGGNVRKFDRISSTTAKDVTVGETVYAFAIDFYGFTQIASAGRTNMTFALPEDFTAISPDGVAILKGAVNLEVARRFMEFVLSEEGQKLWFLPVGHPEGPRQHSIERMAVRPDFYPRYRGVSNIEFSPFELKQKFVYDASLARARREIVAALCGALMVDTHSELKHAWQSIIARGDAAGGKVALGRMPLTEAEALAMVKSAWKEPAFRNQKKIEWQRWAMEKYRELAARR